MSGGIEDVPASLHRSIKGCSTPQYKVAATQCASTPPIPLLSDSGEQCHCPWCSSDSFESDCEVPVLHLHLSRLALTTILLLLPLSKILENYVSLMR